MESIGGRMRLVVPQPSGAGPGSGTGLLNLTLNGGVREQSAWENPPLLEFEQSSFW